MFYKWNKWFWLGKAVTKTGSCPNNTRSFSQRAEGLGSPFSVQYTYNLYSKSEVFWEWETLFKLKNGNNQDCSEQAQDICHSSQIQYQMHYHNFCAFGDSTDQLKKVVLS